MFSHILVTGSRNRKHLIGWFFYFKNLQNFHCLAVETRNCWQAPLTRFASGFKARWCIFAQMVAAYVCICFLNVLSWVLCFFCYTIGVLDACEIVKIVLHFFSCCFLAFFNLYSHALCTTVNLFDCLLVWFLILYVQLLACLIFCSAFVHCFIHFCC